MAGGQDPLLPNAGDQALVQLIHVGANGIVDAPPNVGGAVLGDDVLLYSCIYEYDGTNYYWDAWAVGSFGTVKVPFLGNGKVYGRIFDSTNAPVDSWYYQGHAQEMSAFAAGTVSNSIPEAYDLGQGVMNFASNQVAEIHHGLGISDYSVIEGNVGGTNAVFTVSLSCPSAQNVSVEFSTENGTALAAGDYAVTNGTLLFAPGETNKTIAVQIIGDIEIEADETFFVNLSGAVNASVVDAQGVGMITNDDGLPGQVHFFDWKPVDSPQLRDQLFGVIVMAKDAASNTVTTFSGPVALSATKGVDLPIAITPTNSGSFSNGIWTGSMAALEAGNGVVLWSTDGDGHSGSSNPFDVQVASNYFHFDFISTYGISEGHPDSDLGGMDPLLPNAGDQALVQLIHVGENGVPDAPPAPGGVVLGDDVLLYSYIYEYDGQNYYWDAWAAGSLGTATVPFVGNGQVYGRIFDSTDVPVDSWYYQGHVQEMSAFAVGSITDPITENYNLGQGAMNFASNQIAVLAVPQINISDSNVTEGNINGTNAVFTVSLTFPSLQNVSVDFATEDGTALAGNDYVSTNGTLMFAPGVSNQTVTVQVNVDVDIEPNEAFYVNLSDAVNAPIEDAQGVGTIINDDGLPGQVQFFDWEPVSSPQIGNQPFDVMVTARDATSNTVTTFSGPVALSATRVVYAPMPMFSNAVHSSYSSGNYTYGQSFTPDVDIRVTHLRHYFGTRVSIWTDSGVLLASKNVTGTPGTWTETALDTPLILSAGTRYRIGAYTGGGAYYYRYDMSGSFSDGVIHQAYSSSGDGFPSNPTSRQWFLVDLCYQVGVKTPIAMTPSNSGSFVSGMWTGSMRVLDVGEEVMLWATDAEGHGGTSDHFDVHVASNLFHVDFKSTFGISEGHPDSDLGGMDPLLPNAGDQALVQLIHVGENGVPDAPPAPGGVVLGDDVLLYSHIYEYDGTNYYWDAWAVGSFGTATVPFVGNGQVYSRIFDSTNAPVDSWYYQGHVQQMSSFPTGTVLGSTPEVYDLGQGVLNFASNQISASHWLDVSINGNGSINVAEGWYPEGTNLQLVARADAGWLFMGWSGDLSGNYTTASTNLLMNADKLISVIFSDDADRDGLTNSEEDALGTNPRDDDSDSDGMTDGWEQSHGLQPLVNDSAADNDNDGMLNRQEYIAGTDPTNGCSFFDGAGSVEDAGDQVVLEWQPVAGRWYNIYRSTNMLHGFQTLETDLEYPQNSYTDAVHNVSKGFYNIGVRLK